MKKRVREYERVMPDRRGYLALHHNLARCYFRLGQIEAAKREHEIAQQIREFQDALDAAAGKIRETPDAPEGYMALAKIYAAHNQPQKAFEQYKNRYSQRYRFDGRLRSNRHTLYSVPTGEKSNYRLQNRCRR